MDSLAIYLLLLFSLTAVAIPPTTAATTIGVTYSTPLSVRISPDRIAKKVVSMKIPAVRLLDSTPAMIGAFANTSVSLFLSVPNPLVPLIASNRSLAMHWVNRHVVRFYPLTKIAIIFVGNDDASSYSPDVSPFLLQAMQNIRRSLKDLRINNISVSTTFSFFNVVSRAFPPSSARFQQPKGEVVIRPILQFLERTNSSFLIKLEPYNHRYSCSISMGFALFEDSPLSFTTDHATGVTYSNLFDVMYDSLLTSMAAMGHANVPIIVSEIGWPSSGVDAREVDASLLYSKMFLVSLKHHLNSQALKKQGLVAVYIFELVDNDSKQGVRKWGILHQNLTAKYSYIFDDGHKSHQTTSLAARAMHFIGILIWLLKCCIVIACFLSGINPEEVQRRIKVLNQIQQYFWNY